MGEVQTDIPPPILGTDDIGVDVQFETTVQDLGAVTHKSVLTGGKVVDLLVVEGVVGKTVVPVESDIDSVKQSEVDTGIEGVGILPGKAVIHEATHTEGKSVRRTCSIGC